MSSSSETSIQLGSYQLGARLGEGGSSEVYRATGPGGGEVAVKLLGPHADLDDERIRTRFLRERALLAEVSHPNLVRLLDVGDDPELGPYLVTELIDGPSLRERIAGARGLGPDRAALFAEPIAAAVAALHERDLVHRDLKPENVIATDRGQVVLIDLGLALRPGQTRYTDEGEVVGSVPYMAPEQLEGREVGPAADVWALGVLLYEMIAGVRPFARERPSEEAAAILVGNAPPIETRDRRVGAPMAALIARCLRAAPGERPTAAEVAGALGAACDFCEPGANESTRARHLAEPVAAELELARLRAGQIADEAGRLLAAGRAFEALALIDRGLAYDAGDGRLQELARDEIEPERRTVPPPRIWPRAAIAIVAVGLIAAAIALALRDDGAGDEPVATDDGAATGDRVALSPAPADDDIVASASGERAARRRTAGERSDRAARRVASGFGELVMRGLAAERDADGKLIARQGGPGEASNEELTLAVMGGLLDLFEEGVAARAADEGGETVTIAAIDPRRLSDRDRPRDPGSLEAGDEPLIVMAGKTGDQIKVVLGELERMRADNPDDPHLRVSLALYRMAAGQLAAGERELEALLAERPRFSYARVAAALLASRRGDQAKALMHLDRALELDPKNDDALALRGRVRFHQGETASAYRDLRAAIAVDDRNTDALATLAALYEAIEGAGAGRPLIDQLRALAADPSAGPKAARRLRELCQSKVEDAC